MKNSRIRTCADLFLTFLRIGLFTFGGGYAMLSIIEDICVEKKKWITHDEFLNLIVVAESTPGPVAINSATYIGYRQGGMAGACAATVGVIVPSFVIIYVISMFLDNFLEIRVIASAFRGIKVGVGFLIVNAALNLIKKMPMGKLCRVILVVSIAAMLLINVFSWNFSSISMMLIAGAVSLAAYCAGGRAEEGGRP